MDTYLEMAEQVLRSARRPMTALQILKLAYAEGMAPAHLRGRTQHKTLQARLSEDILKRRDDSRFYRTAPGRFLLREFIEDAAIPLKDRRPIIARRRRRDLPTDRAVAFECNDVCCNVSRSEVAQPNTVLDLIRQGDYHYTSNARKRRSRDVILWSFVIVVKDFQVLTYRQGPYREDRDTFLLKRTIGFYAPVIDTDNTLFDRSDHGIVSSGVRAVATDLGLRYDEVLKEIDGSTALHGFILPNDGGSGRDLLAIVSFRCPAWLEPTSRRLAINDLQWIDLRSTPNHQEDFDPWSQVVLSEARRIVLDGLP